MTSFDFQRIKSQLWLQRRDLVLAVGVGILTLPLLFFGVYQMWQNIALARAELKRQTTALEQSKQRSALITQISDEDRKLFTSVGQALPLSKEPLLVLGTLDAIAQSTGVSIGQYDLNPGIISTEAAIAAASTSRSSRAKTQSDVKNLPLQIEVVGTFSQVTNALEAIEKAAPLLEVTELGINPSKRKDVGAQDSTNSVSYTATLQLNSFYAPFDAQKLAKGGAQKLSAEQQKTKELIKTFQFRSEAAATQPGRPTQFDKKNLFQMNSPAPRSATIQDEEATESASVSTENTSE